MAFERYDNDEFELGFENPQPGVSICQITDGIDLLENEETGSQTYRIPMTIVDVVEGPESNQDLRLSMFINAIKRDGTENEFGWKQLNAILTLTGTIEDFMKRFSGKDVAINDPKLVEGLQIKLPDKLLKVTHKLRKGPDGTERSDIVKIEAVKKGSGKAKNKKAPAEPTPNIDDTDADW